MAESWASSMAVEWAEKWDVWRVGQTVDLEAASKVALSDASMVAQMDGPRAGD